MSRILAALFFTLAALSTASVIAADAPTVVTLNLTKDLVTFIQGAVTLGGIFLTVFAFLCVMFFGVDVKNARKEISLATAEMKTAALEAKQVELDIRKRKLEFEEFFRDAKEKVELIGSTVEGVAAGAKDPKYPKQLGRFSTRDHTMPPVATGVDSADIEGVPDDQVAPAKTRAPSALIAELLMSSKFPWTTMTRLKNTTGWDEEFIRTVVNSMPGVILGYNRTTKEQLFKLDDGQAV